MTNTDTPASETDQASPPAAPTTLDEMFVELKKCSENRTLSEDVLVCSDG